MELVPIMNYIQHSLDYIFAGLFFAVFTCFLIWCHADGRTCLFESNPIPFWLVEPFISCCLFISIYKYLDYLGIEVYCGIFSPTWRYSFTLRASTRSRCRSTATCCCQSIANFFAFPGFVQNFQYVFPCYFLTNDFTF